MKYQVSSLFSLMICEMLPLSRRDTIHTAAKKSVREIEKEQIISCSLYSWINSLWMSHISSACVFTRLRAVFDVL